MDPGYGVIGRKKGGAVVMSYSPPNERHQKPWLNDRPDSNRDSHRGKMPELTSSRTRPQTAGGPSRNKGTFHPARSAALIPHTNKYQHIQSRVKDQINQHKRAHKEMKSQNRGGPGGSENGDNNMMASSKEPQIYYKERPPAPRKEANRANGGALRRRSSPNKGENDDYG